MSKELYPEHNRNYVMNDIQPYQFEPEGTLEEEDDSDHFEENEIIEETLRRTGNTWLVSVWTNGFLEGISLLPFCAKFKLYFSWFKCELYITTSWMVEISTLTSNYNLRQSRECSYNIRSFEFSPSRLQICLPVQP